MQSNPKAILAAVFLSLITLNLFSQEEPIVLLTKTGNIKGTLTIPSDIQGVPVVLIISGSGPTVFAVMNDLKQAELVKDWLTENFLQNEEGFCHICHLDEQGARVLGKEL